MVCAWSLALCAPAAAAQDFTHYVNPLSGTFGAGFPMVSAAVPLGLIQPGPDTVLESGDEVLAVLDPGVEEDLKSYFGPDGSASE